MQSGRQRAVPNRVDWKRFQFLPNYYTAIGRKVQFFSFQPGDFSYFHKAAANPLGRITTPEIASIPLCIGESSTLWDKQRRNLLL